MACIARFRSTFVEFFRIWCTRPFPRPAYFITSGRPRRKLRAPKSTCPVHVCAVAVIYVPIAEERVPEKAKMMPGFKMVSDLIPMLVQNPNYGRSPSEMALQILDISYPSLYQLRPTALSTLGILRFSKILT